MQKCVYLTAIQCQNFLQVFAMHRNPKPNRWFDRSYDNPQDYDLYFNPIINRFHGELTPIDEMCLSFPFFRAMVDRYTNIDVTYDRVTNL
jgi:peptide deformylase